MDLILEHSRVQVVSEDLRAVASEDFRVDCTVISEDFRVDSAVVSEDAVQVVSEVFGVILGDSAVRGWVANLRSSYIRRCLK